MLSTWASLHDTQRSPVSPQVQSPILVVAGAAAAAAATTATTATLLPSWGWGCIICKVARPKHDIIVLVPALNPAIIAVVFVFILHIVLLLLQTCVQDMV